MNEELLEVNKKLLEYVQNINWEERKFYIAAEIFSKLISSYGANSVTSNHAYYGTLATASIEAANILINKYLEKECTNG